ncbi:hypothetical protein TNCV_2994451 [Trichonephila clavipes]|nr:hypothetical protein TNCV_2994451 [Trichonephila clavipes]
MQENNAIGQHAWEFRLDGSSKHISGHGHELAAGNPDFIEESTCRGAGARRSVLAESPYADVVWNSTRQNTQCDSGSKTVSFGNRTKNFIPNNPKQAVCEWSVCTQANGVYSVRSEERGLFNVEIGCKVNGVKYCLWTSPNSV